MKMKDTKKGVLRRIWIISVALLVLSLVIIPTPDSVVAGNTTVSIELKAGWNFINVPESISASDLALKSKHIINIVHVDSDGCYVSYDPSLGATDFICEPNEGIYVYSEADATLTFTVFALTGDINGDLIVTGDTILNKSLTVNGSMSVSGNLGINGLNVTEDLTVYGHLTVNEDLAIGNDLIVDGNLTVRKNLTVGDLTITEDMTINDDLTVSGDAIIHGDSAVVGDMVVVGNLTVINMTVGNLIVTEDLTIDGDIAVKEDIIVGGDSIVTGDMVVGGNLTAADLTVGKVTVTEDLMINGNLSVTGDSIVGGDSTVMGDMEVIGNLTASNLMVDKDILVNGNLSVINDVTIGGNLTASNLTADNLLVDKDILVNGDLSVINDVTIWGILTAGNLIADNLVVNRDVLISNNLSVTKDVTIGGNLTVGNFTVNDDFTINGDYTVTGNMVVGGDLVVSGNITGLTLGDMANYVIGRDDTGQYYARNGNTGEMQFKSTNASLTIQQAIEALNNSNREGGVVYLKKADYTQYYEIPGKGTLVRVDYTIDTTISVPDGISIISDGALLKVTSLNATVFEFNPEGIGYFSQHLNPWGVSGLSFIGDGNNTNACAIHIYEWQHGFIVDNIYTEYMAYAVRVEGSAYRTVIQNSNFVNGAGRRGIIAVHFLKGRGSYPPNAATILNCDISSYESGVQVDQGYGVRIANNYFENNGVAINLFGTQVTVIGNYIQPGNNKTGIYVGGGTPTITANTFLLGANAKYAYGIHATNGALISSNIVITDSDSNAFFYSEVPVSVNIVGNVVGLKIGADESRFIDAKLVRSLVANNKISRGNPAIRQRDPAPVHPNRYIGNSFYAPIEGINTSGKDYISDNHFYSFTVAIDLNGNNNIVKDNYFSSGTEEINMSGMGSGNIIEDNIGYATERSGTTSAGTSIVVTHGLAGTPDQVTVTPLGQTNYFYVTSKGATTFTIISEASVAFDWYAVYKP